MQLEVIHHKKITQGVALALGLVALVFTFFRFHWGVDLSDEPFYLAMAYRFVLGDRPYFDEYQLVQGVSLLNYFLVKPYVLLTGGTKGIVLAGRYAYYALAFMVSFAAFFTFKKFTSQTIAWLSALTYLVIIPFGLPGLGYNNVGTAFLTLGLLSAFTHLALHRSSLYLLVAGISLGLASVAHPAHIGSTAVFLGVLFLFSPQKRLLNVAYCLTGWVALLLLIAFFHRITWSNFLSSYVATSLMNKDFGNELSLAKMFGVLKNLSRLIPWQVGGLAFLSFIIPKRFSTFKNSLLAVGALPVLYLFLRKAGGLHALVIAYALLAPFFGWRENNPALKRSLLWIWLPSVVSGLALSLASYNGAFTATVGLWPATLITSLCLSSWLESRVSFSVRDLLTILPAAQALLLFTYLQMYVLYMEDPLHKLTVQLRTGPFAGLWTSPEKAKFLWGVEEEFKKREVAHNGRLLIYPHFPGGYLFTSRRPATVTVWGCLSNDRPKCKDYFLDHANPNTVAMRINELCRFEGTCYSGALDPELDKIVESKFKDKVELGPYTFFAKPTF